jgi:hypothetical protein
MHILCAHKEYRIDTRLQFQEHSFGKQEQLSTCHPRKEMTANSGLHFSFPTNVWSFRFVPPSLHVRPEAFDLRARTHDGLSWPWICHCHFPSLCIRALLSGANLALPNESIIICRDSAWGNEAGLAVRLPPRLYGLDKSM